MSQGECVTAEWVCERLQRAHQVIQYVFQLERAPTTGRLHFQGYVRLTGAQRLSYVRGLLTEDTHWEVARGTHAQCVAYCKKRDSRVQGPWEMGEEPEQGKRSDIDVVRELIASGQGMGSVVDVASSYQAMKAAELLLKYKEPGRTWKPHVRWYFGSTGAGKTRAAMEEFPNAWLSARNLKWWEGYDAHEAVVLDDFRKDFCTFHELLRILDRYAYRIETKGSSRQLLAKTIIITCPHHPEVLFEQRSAEDIGQLLRRIDVIKQFGDVVPPPVHMACVPHFRG